MESHNNDFLNLCWGMGDNKLSLVGHKPISAIIGMRSDQKTLINEFNKQKSTSQNCIRQHATIF